MNDAVRKNDFEAALAAGATIAGHAEVDGTPYAFVPQGWTVENLSAMLDAPTRAKGSVTLNDVPSFVAYIARFRDTRRSLIYMLPPQRVDVAPTFVAVLNEHTPGDSVDPAWRDWRAAYSPTLSPEWTTWLGANKRQMQQAEFAAFIEDNLPDVASPPGADLLTIARSIEAKKKVNFASSIRLSDGSHQLTYEEQIEGSAAKGQLTIPESIKLAIPVLLNGPRYAVEARLRYRIGEGGKLVLWIDLLRPHEILQHAIDEARKVVAEGTGLPILVGRPD